MARQVRKYTLPQGFNSVFWKLLVKRIWFTERSLVVFLSFSPLDPAQVNRKKRRVQQPGSQWRLQLLTRMGQVRVGEQQNGSGAAGGCDFFPAWTAWGGRGGICLVLLGMVPCVPPCPPFEWTEQDPAITRSATVGVQHSQGSTRQTSASGTSPLSGLSLAPSRRRQEHMQAGSRKHVASNQSISVHLWLLLPSSVLCWATHRNERLQQRKGDVCTAGSGRLHPPQVWEREEKVEVCWWWTTPGGQRESSRCVAEGQDSCYCRPLPGRVRAAHSVGWAGHAAALVPGGVGGYARALLE